MNSVRLNKQASVMLGGETEACDGSKALRCEALQSDCNTSAGECQSHRIAVSILLDTCLHLEQLHHEAGVSNLTRLLAASDAGERCRLEAAAQFHRAQAEKQRRQRRRLEALAGW